MDTIRRSKGNLMSTETVGLGNLTADGDVLRTRNITKSSTTVGLALFQVMDDAGNIPMKPWLLTITPRVDEQDAISVARRIRNTEGLST